jgi:DNA-binding transcriptional ArsR family regulator
MSRAVFVKMIDFILGYAKLEGMRLKSFDENADKATRLLKSLASKPRLMVLCQLAEGEHSVGELLANSGLSQSALSQHLAKLREDDLVQTRKESQTVYYRLKSKPAAKVLKTLHSIFCQ